jgi:Cu/Ag efflux pump CusA
LEHERRREVDLSRTPGPLLIGSVLVVILLAFFLYGIMLISHYRHLEREERMPFGRELVLRGAEERLAPIVMTAAAAGLALLPIVLGGNRPGHEIEHPMAVIIVGGLVTSTLLNLYVVPGLYLAYGRKETAAT